MDSDKKEKVCGIILICGYLGSGKTTLIQHILKTQSKYKVAVIQNEYSDGKNKCFFMLKRWELKVQ